MKQFVEKIPYRYLEDQYIKDEANYVRYEAVRLIGNKDNNILLREFVHKIRGDFDEINSDLGSITIYNNLKFKIVIPKYVLKEKNNFTIAHELGHLFLHTRVKEEDIENPNEYITFLRYGIGKQEAQANRFASYFLMPDDVFLEKRKEFQYDIIDLSNYFKVSVQDVSIRLKQFNND